MGEPESTAVWPGYVSTTPARDRRSCSTRRPDRPAYPMLRPHLAARPPFAPGHGPAGHIDRPRPDGLPAPPGADGESSLCPAGTTMRTFSMRATELPVPLNARLGLVDPAGRPVRAGRGRSCRARRPVATQSAGDPGQRRRALPRRDRLQRGARQRQPPVQQDQRAHPLRCSSTCRPVTGSTPGSTSSRPCDRSPPRGRRSPTRRSPARRASPSATPTASAWARSSASAWRTARGSRSAASTPSTAEARSCSTVPSNGRTPPAPSSARSSCGIAGTPTCRSAPRTSTTT